MHEEEKLRDTRMDEEGVHRCYGRGRRLAYKSVKKGERGERDI